MKYCGGGIITTMTWMSLKLKDSLRRGIQHVQTPCLPFLCLPPC